MLGSASGLPQVHSLVPHLPPPITAMATVIPTAMVAITPTVIPTAMVTITRRLIAPPISPRLTPPPMRRRLTETTATETTPIETTAMVFVTPATAMVFATASAAMVFATRAIAPLTWEDRSDFAGTGADMLGRDMDVALGKPVLSHRVAEQASTSGNRPDARKLDNTRAMINLTRPLNYRWGLFSFRS